MVNQAVKILFAIAICIHSLDLYAKTREQPISQNQAFELSKAERKKLLRAAKNGNINAAVKLGNYFDFVEYDFEKATYWYKFAADNGHAISQFNLGVRLLGKKDLRSCKEARHWFQLAKRNGVQEAGAALAKLPNCETTYEK